MKCLNLPSTSPSLDCEAEHIRLHVIPHQTHNKRLDKPSDKLLHCPDDSVARGQYPGTSIVGQRQLRVVHAIGNPCNVPG